MDLFITVLTLIHPLLFLKVLLLRSLQLMRCCAACLRVTFNSRLVPSQMSSILFAYFSRLGLYMIYTDNGWRMKNFTLIQNLSYLYHIFHRLFHSKRVDKDIDIIKNNPSVISVPLYKTPYIEIRNWFKAFLRLSMHVTSQQCHSL